jgi:hypothetical protein
MQEALRLPEIVGLIVESVLENDYTYMYKGHVGSYRSSDKRRLKKARALMLTSKVFSHFALNHLWREITGIQQLLSPIPSDIWTISQEIIPNFPHGHREGPALVLKRPLRSNEWERFDFYAKRIKRIHFRYHSDHWSNKKDGACFSPTIFTQLVEARSLPLFPNLETVHTKETYYEQWGDYVIPYLIQSSLRNLRVCFLHFDRSKRPDPGPFLHAARKSLSRLREFEITNPTNLDIWNEKYGLFDTIKCNPLERLAIDTHGWKYSATHGNFFDRIGSSLHLTSLDIELTSEVMSGIDEYSQQIFPNLKDLSFNAYTLKDAIKFIQLLHGPHLEILRTGLRPPHYASDLTAYFTVVSDLLDSTSLTQFSMHDPYSSFLDEPDAESVLSAAVLRLLFCFPNITDMALYLYVDLRLVDDSLLMQMSIAWPRLEVLDFRCCDKFPCSVTFSGLVEFSRQCASLTTMYLPFRDNFMPDSFDEHSTKITALKRLSIGYAVLDNVEGAGKALAKAFPLIEVDYIMGIHGDAKFWQELKNTIRAYQVQEGTIPWIEWARMNWHGLLEG